MNKEPYGMSINSDLQNTVQTAEYTNSQ